MQGELQTYHKQRAEWKQQLQELDKERKALFEKNVKLEQKIAESERDYELQKIKVDSLENVIQKRSLVGGGISV